MKYVVALMVFLTVMVGASFAYQAAVVNNRSCAPQKLEATLALPDSVD